MEGGFGQTKDKLMPENEGSQEQERRLTSLFFLPLLSSALSLFSATTSNYFILFSVSLISIFFDAYVYSYEIYYMFY